MNNNNSYLTICSECKGQGKKSKRIRKKAKRDYLKALEQFKKSDSKENFPIPPKGHLYNCVTCNGSGLIHSSTPPIVNKENYPHISIIGAGIGGVALAVACLHRGIPFSLFERDSSFDVRSQGYGLTLQQASKAIQGLGIFSLEEGIISTKHVVHTTEGEIIGEWGMRKWLQLGNKKQNKRTNIHISRQSLRLKLLEQLNGHATVKWGHQLIDLKENKGNYVNLSFLVNGKIENIKSDVVVGADGIRSSVRKLLIGEELNPLRYLGCIVILGICSLKNLKDSNHHLLDLETVFQTANGNERIYMMPYSKDAIMWQLSFPMSEQEAKSLSAKGAKALKKEARQRIQWHKPIPDILASTPETLISGYPIYDRKLISHELLNKGKFTTLIGDAAHPMSPFKGQGANQALLDALALARGIYKECRPQSNWKSIGIRKSVLTDFEKTMIERSSSKVIDSAKAVQFLHSNVVLHKSNTPRGTTFNKKNIE